MSSHHQPFRLYLTAAAISYAKRNGMNNQWSSRLGRQVTRKPTCSNTAQAPLVWSGDVTATISEGAPTDSTARPPSSPGEWPMPVLIVPPPQTPPGPIILPLTPPLFPP